MGGFKTKDKGTATLILMVAATVLNGCSQPKQNAPQKHYTLTGSVVSIDAKEHTVNVDGAAIPDYMGAMKMDYPVPSEGELAALKVGEKISATVNVSEDGSYTLSNIHDASASGK